MYLCMCCKFFSLFFLKNLAILRYRHDKKNGLILYKLVKKDGVSLFFCYHQ